MADENFKLSDAEHKMILNIIFDNVIGHSKPEDNPVIFVLGGQPGCGKSSLINKDLENFSEDSVVIINGDEFRHYHPFAREIFEKYPERYAELTDLDVRDWTQQVFEKALKEKHNIIFEGTMRTNKICETIKRVQNMGYVVNVQVLAVSAPESKLSIYGRYEEQMEKSPTPRFTPISAHDASFQGMLNTLQQIEDEEIYNTLTVYSRDMSVVFQSTKQKPQKGVVEAVEKFRNKVWAQTKYKGFVSHIEKVKAKAKKRNESDKYIKSVESLKKEAVELCKIPAKKELSELLSNLINSKLR